MSFIIRAATRDDLQHLYEMAKLTGGGFTNLPPDRPSLTAKLDLSTKAFERTDDTLEDETFVLILENTETGEVRGTSQLFTQVGQKWPFYSYRITSLTQHSKELNRTMRADMLSLVNDLEGSSEVGGLFLHPSERAGGLGLLLARSRYLFIAAHRPRFGDQILAELRGIIDEKGGSPFWDAIGGRFFGMSFQEADEFNAIHGNQFIADLMPKHPVYISMLEDGARKVIGLPHPNGRAAMRMLENEGFAYHQYVDIFDGGPSMTARTDQVRSIRDAVEMSLDGLLDEGTGEKALIATGHLASFRCCYGNRMLEDDSIRVDPMTAKALNITDGDMVWSIAR
ncbi:arginine N-succinyltransferase [Altericroceibacterium endophyticum]|uniref:Arginine N-succinyltransferase n=1 Tax=Altericroceibacterium endophyticum TaxID=1808508 RepID=A0A6I4T7X7_9SPHN|nr:arginine N-succinyltransferase [Altericroceibacterium endophyticum]MXO66788.1 arginine N-succinyltransferase [Altericroceibacterium endophyticum]